MTGFSNEINPGISKLFAVVGRSFWTEYLMSYVRITDLKSWPFHTRKLQYLHFFNQSGGEFMHVSVMNAIVFYLTLIVLHAENILNSRFVVFIDIFSH